MHDTAQVCCAEFFAQSRMPIHSAATMLIGRVRDCLYSKIFHPLMSRSRIRYIGNLTRHGSIAPSSQDIVHAQALVLGPGLYEVPGSKLEVEVGKERGERWERFSQEIVGRCTVEVSSSLEPQLI